MSEWRIEYWHDDKSTFELWLNKLNKEELKGISKEIKLLELSGNKLKLPHSKSLGKGLFELRERTYGHRIYYCFVTGGTVILLHAGKKTTQKKDIKIARNRVLNLKG